MTDPAARRAADAERQRRCRDRKKLNQRVVPLLVGVDQTERLIELGLLHAWRDEDVEAIARAVDAFLQRHLVEAVTRDGAASRDRR